MHPELAHIDVTNAEDLRAVREHTLLNRINTTRGHLATLCAKGNYSDVGVFQFLNQAMLMMREAFVFAVGLDTQKECAITNMTVHDEALFPLFSHAISEITHDGTIPEPPTHDAEGKYDNVKVLLNRDSSKKYRIPVFGTNFFVIAMAVNELKSVDTGASTPNARYRLCSIESEMGKFLTILFYRFDRAVESTGMKKYIRERVLEASSLPRVARLIDPAALPPPMRKEEDIISKALGEMSAILGRDFDDSELSPVLSQRGRKPANILFNAKVFDRKDVRYAAYTFNNYVVSVRSQSQQFLEALAYLRSCEVDGRFWYDSRYPDSRRRKPRFAYRATDEVFWEHIRDDNGSVLLSIVESELGANTRLATDHVLRSGSASVLVDPFHRANIGRVAQRARSKLLNSPGDMMNYHRKISTGHSKEQLRLATLHYLAQTMVQGAPSHSMLSFPVVVNGATWMSVTVTRADDEPRGIFTTPEQWQLDRIFYDRIFSPIERHVRRRSRAAYLDLVADAVFKQLQDDNRRTSQEVMARGPLAESVLDDELARLTRVFPYNRIEFRSYNQHSESWLKKRRYHRAIEGFPYFFRILDNDFYDRNTKQHYIRPEELSATIKAKLADLRE